MPVLLAFSTTIAVGVLAAHWLPGARRPWIAALLTAMTGSLNTTYFSPQSTGFLISIVILVLATGPLRDAAVTTADGSAPPKPRARRVGLSRIVAITLIGIVLAVTHQILAVPDGRRTRHAHRVPDAPPLVAALVVLVPAVVFAALNGRHPRTVPVARGGRTGARQRAAARARHDVLPKPLVTRLAFDIPAAALVVLGSSPC